MKSDSPRAPYLRLKALVKAFGPVRAVDQVTLDIGRGEFFALLGPSGCGKTTLLRMLAGFETPDSGVIEVDGVDISKTPPYMRPVNMMFQSYALFPHMNVADNIAFGLKQEGMPKPEIARRVEEMLTLVELTAEAKRRPDQMSGGQRQRVALARALAKRPKLLLLDEPLAALDKRLRERTQFELMNIQQKLGITFVMVTHDQSEAMTMASRMAVMDRGRIRQVGSPPEIYERPNSRFVADFIGDINLFDGEVAAVSDGRASVKIADLPESIDVTGSDGISMGQKVALALRPEKLLLSRTKPEDARQNRVEGTVFDVGYRGDLSIYHVTLASGRAVSVVDLNSNRTDANTLVAQGDRVWLAWAADAGIILPAS